MSFQSNFDWQMKFLTTISNIVGPHLLKPAPTEIDMTQATDLLVIRARDMRIGCRVRRLGYADRYPWQFTIRSQTRNGVETELDKIINGWGDWLFYGHQCTETSISILHWFLVDLHSLRAHMIKKTCPWENEISNGDGTFFRPFNVRRFPESPAICVAKEVPQKYHYGTLTQSFG